MDDDKQTPTSPRVDPEDRPSQGGVLGGGKPYDDKRPSDPVPQHEVKPGEQPARDGT